MNRLTEYCYFNGANHIRFKGEKIWALHNKRNARLGIDKARIRLAEYEDIGLTPKEINETLHRFSAFLSKMTGNKMSKTNYTLESMITVAEDYFEDICNEDCEYKKMADEYAIQQQNDWISVSVELPTSVANRVLCLIDERCGVYLGHYEGKDGWYNLETGKPFDCNVTHWRELPKEL